MHKFAIKINLSAFFDDERKQALVLVNPDWGNVEMLQQRVESVFQIANVRFLTDTGYFLPPSEDIELLKFCDVLRVITAEGTRDRRRRKTRRSESTREMVIESPPAKTKKLKRKFCSLQNVEFSSSTPNQAKRTRNHNISHPSIGQLEAQPQPHRYNGGSSEITSTNALAEGGGETQTAALEPAAELELPVEDTQLSPRKSKSKKNHSLRKRKAAAAALEDSLLSQATRYSGGLNTPPETALPTAEITSSPAQTADEASSFTEPNRLSKNSSKQIKLTACGKALGKRAFLDTTPDERQNHTDKSPPVKVVFRCALNEAGELRTTRVFKIGKHAHATSKTPLKIQEVVVIPAPLEEMGNQTLPDLPPEDVSTTDALIPADIPIKSDEDGETPNGTGCHTTLLEITNANTTDSESYLDESVVIALDSDDEDDEDVDAISKNVDSTSVIEKPAALQENASQDDELDSMDIVDLNDTTNPVPSSSNDDGF